MDDQLNQVQSTPNVLDTAPTMGDVASPSTTTPADPSVAAPQAAAPSFNSADPVTSTPVEEPVKADDDSVAAALKRIEDKLNAIAVKVGA